MEILKKKLKKPMKILNNRCERISEEIRINKIPSFEKQIKTPHPPLISQEPLAVFRRLIFIFHVLEDDFS